MGGFTLVESLIAATILALTVTAVSVPFTAAARNEQGDERRTMSVSLAQELMEEILSKPFDDPQGASAPGPEAGEAGRSDFDNIDDFHGYSESAGNLTDQTGTAITDPAATGLSRYVTAEHVYLAGQDVTVASTFICVTVQVMYNGQPMVSLSRLVYGM